MNVTSLFRDTASQLAIGAGKVINNIVDFFSSLRADITGLFNSNTSFRQVSTDLTLINHNDPKKNSLGNLNDFLDKKCGVNTTEGRVNGEKDNIEEHIYEKIDDAEENIYEKIGNAEENIYEKIEDKEEPIYDTLNEGFLDLVRKIAESRYENKPLTVEVESEYSSVIDSIDKSSENIYSELYDEDIYSEPYETTLSDKNKYNTI